MTSCQIISSFLSLKSFSIRFCTIFLRIFRVNVQAQARYGINFFVKSLLMFGINSFNCVVQRACGQNSNHLLLWHFSTNLFYNYREFCIFLSNRCVFFSNVLNEVSFVFFVVVYKISFYTTKRIFPLCSTVFPRILFGFKVLLSLISRHQV